MSGRVEEAPITLAEIVNNWGHPTRARGVRGKSPRLHFVVLFFFGFPTVLGVCLVWR